jgi:hypothetical protein
MFRNHPWVDTKSLVKLLGGFTRFTMSLPAVQATFKQRSSNIQATGNTHTPLVPSKSSDHMPFAMCRTEQSRAEQQSKT